MTTGHHRLHGLVSATNAVEFRGRKVAHVICHRMKWDRSGAVIEFKSRPEGFDKTIEGQTFQIYSRVDFKYFIRGVRNVKLKFR